MGLIFFIVSLPGSSGERLPHCPYLGDAPVWAEGNREMDPLKKVCVLVEERPMVAPRHLLLDHGQRLGFRNAPAVTTPIIVNRVDTLARGAEGDCKNLSCIRVRSGRM